MLRKNDDSPCPFGLPISRGCRCIGEYIDHMGRIDDKSLDKDSIKDLVETNNMIMEWVINRKNGFGQCKYAGSLFDNEEIVECNVDSIAAGMHDGPALAGSPMFYKMYAGVGLDGLYSYPLGYYRDGAIDRGMYYGRYNFPDGNTGRFTLENPGSSYSSIEHKIKKSSNK